MSDNENPLEPVTGSEYFHRGLELFEQGRFDEALRCLDNALELAHVDADICLVKGQVLFELKRTDDALHWIGKAQEFSPLNPEIQLWKGRILHAAQRHRAALACFNRVIDHDGNNAEAHLCRGMALFETGDFDRSREAFDRALDANTANDDRTAEIHYWLAKIERLQGRERRAIRRLEKNVDRHPSHLASYAELGDIYRARALTDPAALQKAREIYEKGMLSDPNDPALHNDYGNLLRELRDFDGSLNHLDRAIAINPDHEVAYFNRGLTYEELSRPAAAIDDFRHALRIDPNDLDARLKIVDNLVLLDRPDDAWAEVEAALKIAQASNEALICAGDVLNRLALEAEARGQFAKARDALSRLIELAPDLINLDEFVPHFTSPAERHRAAVTGYEALHRAEVANVAPPANSAVSRPVSARLMVAMHLARLSEFARVEKLLVEYVAKTPNDFFGHVLFAHLKVETDRAVEAIAHLDRALALRPDFVELLWEKAVILQSEPLRDFTAAVRCYRQILAQPGDHRWCHEPLARLYEEMEMPQRALDHWRHHETFLVDIGEYNRHRPFLAWATARLYVQQEMPAEAIPLLHEALAAPPTSFPTTAAPPADSAGSTATATAAATVSASRDGIGPASRMVVEARAVPPIHRGDVRLMLGIAYAQQGKWMQAREYLQKVVEECRDEPELAAEALMVLVSVALRQRALDDAEMFLDELSDITGGDTRESTLARAAIAYESRQLAHARAFVERVVTHSPERDAQFVEALFLLAKIAIRQRDWQTAHDALAEQLALDPFCLRCIALQSWLYRRHGDVESADECRAEFRIARRFLHALNALRRRDFATARTALVACVAQAPEVAEIHLALAAAHAATDEPALACEALRTAWQLDPEVAEDVPREPLFDRLGAYLPFIELCREMGVEFADFVTAPIPSPAMLSHRPAAPTQPPTTLRPTPTRALPTATPPPPSARVSDSDAGDAQLLHDAEFGIDWDSLET